MGITERVRRQAPSLPGGAAERRMEPPRHLPPHRRSQECRDILSLVSTQHCIHTCISINLPPCTLQQCTRELAPDGDSVITAPRKAPFRTNLASSVHEIMPSRISGCTLQQCTRKTGHDVARLLTAAPIAHCRSVQDTDNACGAVGERTGTSVHQVQAAGEEKGGRQAGNEFNRPVTRHKKRYCSNRDNISSLEM